MDDEQMAFMDDDEMDDEESEEFDFDCGAMYGPKGEPMGCSKVGSEECDWECPYAHAVERSLRAQHAANVRWAKHKAGEGRKA